MTGPVSSNPRAAASVSDSPITAVGLLLLALATIPIVDGIAKYLSASHSNVQIVWARFLFHLLLLLPVVLARHGISSLWPKRPVAQVLRGGCLLLATLFFFGALRTTPMTDALAIFFLAPLMLTALSALILREHVGPRRWLAVTMGFLGVLLIVRPGGAAFQAGALYAVGAAFCYALYAIATRWLSGTAPPLITLAYTAVLGAVVMSLIVPFDWRAPTAVEWGLFVAMGLFAAIAHYLLIVAFERAPASYLAPFGYAEVVSTTLIGYVAFGDFPDRWSWVGIAIVVGSGIYIALRERRPPAVSP